MNRWSHGLGLLCVGVLCARAGEPAAAGAPSSFEQAAREVRVAERAFAASMAERDFAAFSAFVSEEALFFGRTLLRGRAAVLAGWEPFFLELEPPFSWEPETVEALDSGTLALSCGPVRDLQGQVIATFQSIWRKEGDGRWRVIFDKGGPVCPPETDKP